MNPFAKRVFRPDSPLILMKAPEVLPELEKYKPYLVKAAPAPDMPTAGRVRKIFVEKIVTVPADDHDGTFN